MELNKDAVGAAIDAFAEKMPQAPTTGELLAALRFALEAYESVRVAPAPASQQGARFRVVDESESGHCCFKCSVVDTSKPVILNGKHFDNHYESVCETFDRADADMICSALNASSRAQRTDKPS